MSHFSSSNGMTSQISMLVLALAASAMLGSCGGGGGDDDSTVSVAPPPAVNPIPPPPVNPDLPPVYPPEGMWVGTTSTGRSVYGFLLNTTEYWVLYSSQLNPDVIAGAIQGTSKITFIGPLVGASPSGGLESTDAKDFNLEGAGILDATISANYVALQSFNGTVFYTNPPSSGTFATTYDQRWNLTPTLASLAGSFTGAAAVLGGSEPTTLTITDTGNISGTGTSGCTFTGTAAPHVRGNVFDVSVTFGGGACSNGTDTVTGIGYYDIATKRLWGMALNATRSNGFIFAGSKP